MSINKNELTKEQIAKAMSCETAEELMELAKTIGVELTKEEAEAYMVEMEDVELDSDAHAVNECNSRTSPSGDHW